MFEHQRSVPERLITGIPRMDEEHQSLVELIGWIEAICTVGNATDCRACILSMRDRCGSRFQLVLDQLMAYVRDHFRYEERLMNVMAPKEHVGEHSAAHRQIEERLLELADEFVRGGNPAAVSRKAVAELRIWLQEHIESLDLELATYVRSEDAPHAGKEPGSLG